MLVSLPVHLCEVHKGEGRLRDALSGAGVTTVEAVLDELDLEIWDVDWDRSSVRFVASTSHAQ